MTRRSSASERLVQCLRNFPHGTQVRETIDEIAKAYGRSEVPWIVGYSGGKDSTAVVKLIFQSLLRSDYHHQPVTVIYCDTGVEIPVAATLARTALLDLADEARIADIPMATKILRPPLHERFFVKVIGRGYPPPTDKFRWCTDRLRIDPVDRFLRERDVSEATVVLGVREQESSTRRHTLGQNQTADRLWRTQKGVSSRRLFLPILDYSTEQVWITNLFIKHPTSLRAREVADLYASASGECPTIREVNGAPCGKARFGCWTCTVAKNGTTLRNLIAGGKKDLQPLLDFRLWLGTTRSIPRYRRKRRRNGQPGPGPMTLPWRRLALERLLETQRLAQVPLIEPDEVDRIKELWEAE